ncbi:Protein kinase-like domain [Apiospora arundinis]|uniref:Protein kinase-like domain n=1 Tax=Apiospora arundinis TaxID=335852 RepID=A0ABR2IWH9_9PEZI
MQNDALLKRLKELERRAEEADQRAEEAEQQRQLERQRAEEAEKVNRLTTLSVYLEACHEFVYAKFQVEPDKSLTSKGPTTNPQNKLPDAPHPLVRLHRLAKDGVRRPLFTMPDRN